MAAGLDSGAVLRALADHPDAFPALRGDVADFARKAVVKQLKDKGLALAGLRSLERAGGEGMLAAVLDNFEAAELAGLAKKVDVHGPFAKTGGDEAAARRHLLDLAAGRAEPGAKAEKAKPPMTGKAPKPGKLAEAGKPAEAPKEPRSKIGGVLQSKVHSGAARPSRPKKAPG